MGDFMRYAVEISEKLARAASLDAANRQMRDAGRTSWNEDDWNLACEVFGRLMAYEANELRRKLSIEEANRRVNQAQGKQAL